MSYEQDLQKDLQSREYRDAYLQAAQIGNTQEAQVARLQSRIDARADLMRYLATAAKILFFALAFWAIWLICDGVVYQDF